MSALQTPIWANPSALPRASGQVVIPKTPLPAGLTVIKFSALSVPAWPVAPGAFSTSFQITFGDGREPIGFGHSEDAGCPRNKDGSFAVESYVMVTLSTPTDANATIQGTITLGNPLPASGFFLSGQ